jgi:hypothetical protein
VGRTTLARDLIELIRLGKADKEQVLANLAEASAGAEHLRRGPPALTVRFHTLRGVIMAGSRQGAPRVARGTGFLTEAASYDVVAEVAMYPLTDAARVDVVRFGRHPSQDVQLLDAMVSREHGLVILADRLPLFCDYGTFKSGVHAGSTNGTYLAGQVAIRDAMIPWLPGQELMLGGQYARRDGHAYAIKLSYELHDPAAAALN